MKTVVIGVSSRQEANARLMHALATGKPQNAYRSFESTADLWRTISPNRWDVLKEMTGAGAMSLRELARRVERDVKSVHADVHALLNAGLLDKTEDGKIIFPFDAVHVDFMLKAA
ncbi:MAG: helix-turn-helix domain-containing protein [Burkholderiales bacterium]|nr:helix-turn-helix domain-containing protein [Burkholderiales bacterium]